MLFNSIVFLLFFAICFLLFWFGMAKHKKVRNIFLLLSSYFFYAWWDWRFLGLIVLSSVVDFAIGKAIFESENGSKRKALLTTSLAVNLGLLGVFKYYNFFIDSLDAVLVPLGTSVASAHLEIVLPVGISFYTFQTLSYSLDIYRRKLEPTRDPVQFFAFVTFFPQLVAGPIERAKDLLPQFDREELVFDAAMVRSGALLAVWGMFKKIVIADRLALVVDAAFDHPEGIGGASAAWALLCFTGQLYLDFSAYSDIAIGISRMLGFKLSTNFKRPYFASSFGDFWKRWHISLSSWFRDYLYIPLGGNRVSKRRMTLNVMIVFLVSGLWHGASWNFVVWGALNGLFIIGLDPLLVNVLKKSGALGRGLIALIVTTCWALSLAFFRAQTFADAALVLQQIFAWSPVEAAVDSMSDSHHKLTVLLLLFLFFVEGVRERWVNSVAWILDAPRPIRWGAYLALIWGCILIGVHGLQAEDKQFIYFQF
jgi:D-alanyl-lipoteichoic acid acyltransferase DltB (MBOAT superfamily)